LKNKNFKKKFSSFILTFYLTITLVSVADEFVQTFALVTPGFRFEYAACVRVAVIFEFAIGELGLG
jgi:hypothetical protein